MTEVSSAARRRLAYEADGLAKAARRLAATEPSRQAIRAAQANPGAIPPPPPSAPGWSTGPTPLPPHPSGRRTQMPTTGATPAAEDAQAADNETERQLNPGMNAG